MNYLENDICKFTPLFNINYNKKINIVSTTFFKLEGGSYKKFDKYVNGLYNLHNYVKKNMKDFYIRLFIDESIHNDKKIMKKINNLEKIQCVLVNCKNFKSKKNKNKHRGLLGTLFRFFPMFDFKNNDADFVFISDIDWSPTCEMDKMYKYYLYLKKNKYLVDLFVLGKIYKTFIHGFKYKRGDDYVPYVIADRSFNNKRIDSKILIDFIQNENHNEKLTFYKKNMPKVNKKFIFGIDEYFLNKTLMDYLLDNDKKVGIVIKLGVTNEFYYRFRGLNKITNKKIKNIYTDFFKVVLKGINNFEFKNLKQAYGFFDNLTFITDDFKKLSSNQIKVFTNVYLYFIYNFYNDEITSLFYQNKNLLKLFICDNNYFGIIIKESLKFMNSQYKGFVINNIKLPDNIINCLKKIRNKYIKLD